MGNLGLSDGVTLTLQGTAAASFNDVIGKGVTTVTCPPLTSMPITARGSLTPDGTMTFVSNDVTIAATTGSALFKLWPGGNDQVNLGGNYLTLGDPAHSPPLKAGNLNVTWSSNPGAGTYTLFTNFYSKATTAELGEFFNTSSPPGAPPGLQWFDYSSAAGLQWINYDNAKGLIQVQLVPGHGGGAWTNASTTHDGKWNTDANWSPAKPFDKGEIATFDTNIANYNGGAVQIDTAGLVIGGMTLKNTAGLTGNCYTIGSGSINSITLNGGTDSSQNPLPAKITVVAGTHAVVAPLVLASNLEIDPSQDSVLNLTGGISQTGGSCRLTVDGGLTADPADPHTRGTVVLAGVSGLTSPYSGGVVVSGHANLVVTNLSGLTAGAPLTVGAGSKVVLQANLYQNAVASAAPAGSPGINAVPEPGTLALLVVGALAAIAAWMRRKSAA
jgi:hypothetical protein